MARRLTAAERLMAQAAKRRAASAERATIVSVECPVCLAGIGRACTNQAGALIDFHSERRHAAGHALIALEDARKAAPPPRPRTVAPSTRPAGRSKPAQPSANGHKPSWLLVSETKPAHQLGGPRYDVRDRADVLPKDRPPRDTVALTPSAYERLVELAAQSVDGLEVGGIALGMFPRIGEVLITDVGSAGEDAERTATSLRADGAHDAQLADALAQQVGGAILELGGWHSHPRVGATRPSPADAQRSAHMLALLDRGDLRVRAYCELIVSPDRERGWRSPVVSAWVTRRTAPDSSTFVIAPALELRGAGR